MIAIELAARINRITFESLSPPAVETAKEAVLDTVGVTLAGSQGDSVRILSEALGSGSPADALVFGGRRRVGMLDAALINGTAAHALDFDDCSNTLGGHPSAPIVPALWALAETLNAGGRDFLAAYVAGVETETKLGRAVNFHHYEKGWHPTSTLGTFGSAAACGHLLGLDRDAMARALAIAVSMAAGVKANFGTMTKPFHVGQCARNGLLAARLAQAGMTASLDAFEHPQGFFNVFNGAGNFDPDRVFESWAEPFDVIEPGVAFKRHPCCASTHPAIDALLQLREENGLRPENVRTIVSYTHPRRLRHTNRPDPKTGLDGKFSVQYTLARALMDGRVSLGHFTDEAVSDPSVRALMGRITAAPHPDAQAESTEHFFAELHVETEDGRTLKGFVSRPVGRDRDHPLPPGALERKFDDCAAQALDAESAHAVKIAILRLETVADMRTLSDRLADGAREERPGRRHRQPAEARI